MRYISFGCLTMTAYCLTINGREGRVFCVFCISEISRFGASIYPKVAPLSRA